MKWRQQTRQEGYCWEYMNIFVREAHILDLEVFRDPALLLSNACLVKIGNNGSMWGKGVRM